MMIQLSDKRVQDLETVIDYLWSDERDHYLCGREEDHIFRPLARLHGQLRRAEKQSEERANHG